MDNSKYNEAFKDHLSKEKSYEFLLKIKTTIKKDFRKNSTSLEFLDLLKYGINHLKQFNEKESIYNLLESTLELFINKYSIIPQTIPKEKLIKGFIESFDLFNGFENSKNFKSKLLNYCKKNNIDEKFLRVNKCYDIFAIDSIKINHFIDAYTYCMKSENGELIKKLFELLEENVLSGNETLARGLRKKEFLFTVTRTTIELLMNKKMEIAFDFIGKYYKKYGNDNIVIDFGYLLTCLLIREPKGFDHFWALINMYKPIIEKKYDLQFYLNKIAIVYYNKPFLKKQ